MSVGDVTPKILYQGALSTAVTALYTPAANMRAQVIEIWIDNQNTATQRYIDIHAGGTAVTNRLTHKIPCPADQGTVISDAKIVLAPSVPLAMKQDTGTDCIVTIFGYEEQIA